LARTIAPQRISLDGAIDAAIGEDEGRERLRPLARLDAADVEAREVEEAVVAAERQERRVPPLGRQDHDWRLLAVEIAQRPEVGVAVAVGGHGRDRQAVLAEDLDLGAGDRIAVVDRGDEDLAAAVLGLLDEDAEVGDDEEPAVILAEDTLLLRIEGLDLEEEDPAPALPAAEVGAEIDRVVDGLAGARLGERLVLGEALGRVVDVEAVREARVAVLAAALGHDVVQLIGEHAPDLDADAGHVACEERDLLLAGHREQGARVQNAELPREGRHLGDEERGLAEEVAAEGAHALSDVDVEVPTDLALVAERVQRPVLVLLRDGVE
jgi:hypothetical protein